MVLLGYNWFMYNRGFIKHILLFVVLLGFLVIFFTVFAKYFKPSAFIDRAATTPYTDTISDRTNPLIDFQGTNDVYSGTSGGSGAGTTNTSSGSIRSPYAGKVYLSVGNASYAYQPYDEYVTLRNSGTPVVITGWVLTNGKNTRPIENTSQNYAYTLSDSAMIGEGTEFLSPEGKYVTGPITLKNGDTAILTTGGPFSNFQLPIQTSFRENICLGYFDQDYPWSPQLRLDCPTPSQDPQIGTVTQECYDYLRYTNRCEDPEREDKEAFDALRSPCKEYIRTRFTYDGCVATNRDKSGFSTSQWRVFLGKKFELWRKENETITLYDAQGRLIDQVKY
jgi:hypothetical protein